jgi:hypothetical protein
LLVSDGLLVSRPLLEVSDPFDELAAFWDDCVRVFLIVIAYFPVLLTNR